MRKIDSRKRKEVIVGKEIERKSRERIEKEKEGERSEGGRNVCEFDEMNFRNSSEIPFLSFPS